MQKDNLIKYKCLSCNTVYLNKINKKNLKSDSRIHLRFLIVISINCFTAEKRCLNGKSLI